MKSTRNKNRCKSETPLNQIKNHQNNLKSCSVVLNDVYADVTMSDNTVTINNKPSSIDKIP